MQLPQFLARVQEYAPGTSHDDALDATRATLLTLVELLGAEGRDLFAQLPAQLTQSMATDTVSRGESFGVAEFVRRVGQRGGFDEATADRYSRAVLSTLQEAISSGELAQVLARLEPAFIDMFAATRPSSGR